MYAATTRASNSNMVKDVRRALIPILYLDCDRWTSQISGHKYIGELDIVGKHAYRTSKISKGTNEARMNLGLGKSARHVLVRPDVMALEISRENLFRVGEKHLYHGMYEEEPINSDSLGGGPTIRKERLVV